MQKYIYQFKLNTGEIRHIFDVLIASILNFGCEVWMFNPCPKTEGLHLIFLKSTMKVKQSTMTDMMYRECGRFPLQYVRYCRIIIYWWRLHA